MPSSVHTFPELGQVSAAPRSVLTGMRLGSHRTEGAETVASVLNAKWSHTALACQLKIWLMQLEEAADMQKVRSRSRKPLNRYNILKNVLSC